MKPTIGRIVIYKLTQDDADKINRRRTTGLSIAERMRDDKWPTGAQAHIGDKVKAYSDLPMIITAVYDGPVEGSANIIDGQVFLNGTDTFWAQGIEEDEGGDGSVDNDFLDGHWRWPKE